MPEIASRRHAEYISATVDKALADAGMTMADVDAVARLLFDAGGDDVGDDLPPILHNRRRGFVAGGLDT